MKKRVAFIGLFAAAVCVSLTGMALKGSPQESAQSADAAAMSLNRAWPESIARRMAPVHRRPISSMARWYFGQNALRCVSSRPGSIAIAPSS